MKEKLKNLNRWISKYIFFGLSTGSKLFLFFSILFLIVVMWFCYFQGSDIELESHYGKIVDVEYDSDRGFTYSDFTTIIFEDGAIFRFDERINGLYLNHNYTIFYEVKRNRYDFHHYVYEPEYSIEWIPPSEDD